jgi:segregation and condensation protein A
MASVVQVKLDAFEGPLDLLLHLIDQAEVDIFDIPIQQITRQYLDYLDQAQAMELELASEFLVMAATLLLIKSQMLLPKPPVVHHPEDEWTDYEDPRAALVQKLIEYRQFRAIAEQLRVRERFWEFHYVKEPEDLTLYRNVIEIPLDTPRMHKDDLYRAYLRTTHQVKTRHVVRTIQRDEISVRDRMDEIVNQLTSADGKLLFSHLLSIWRDRVYIITTFLAILELIKSRKVRIYQHSPYGDLVIMRREEASDIASE